MRESNFAFPTQNKAAVCITSQLYDRRALDTTSPLPLLNSLTHLVYLTSTSPRIREIMTMDGGLERLVRIIYDFCLSPPPQENPALIYGLTPPNSRPPKQLPTLNPTAWDKQAAYRFSLAFQCVVNIGVRGSEPIRSRVVQAGTLDVVGMILEAWLVSRGFAVGPSASATGLPRESREQRQARKEAQLRAAREQMQKELDQRLAYAAARQEQQRERELEDHQATPVRTHQPHSLSSRPRRPRAEDDSGTVSSSTPNDHKVEPLIIMDLDTHAGTSSTSTHPNSTLLTPSSLPTSGSDTEMSTDVSVTTTPIGTGTPTGSVTIPGRDRSGTVIGRPVWDPLPASGERRRHPHDTGDAGPGPSTTMMMMGRISPDSPANLTDTSRPETETEDDDVDMDRNANRTITGGSSATPSAARSSRRTITGPPRATDSSPERSDPPHHHHHRPRRAVGIVDEPSDSNNDPNGASDAHIIINDAASVTAVDGLPGVGVDGGVGVVGSVEDGIVSLEPNDDFAMGAPPGAPGAIGEGPGGTNALNMNTFNDGPTALRRRGATVIGAAQVDAQLTAHPDITPRAGVVPLPTMGGERGTPGGRQQGRATQTPGGRGGRDERGTQEGGIAPPHPTPVPPPSGSQGAQASQNRIPQSTDSSNNPYRDDDVLLGLQLLAYLSKYPHVRQGFYKPRQAFHPATIDIARQQQLVGVYGLQAMQAQQQRQEGPGRSRKEKERERVAREKEHGSTAANLFKVFTGKDKASGSGSGKDAPNSSTPHLVAPSLPPRVTNVFSLVERFTFKPSSAETEMLQNPPPEIPNDIQYWAGVIMRNACRKDDSRGGIRQCANMLCGKWEQYPREFAKCRRCRKAKYCGKECQSTAWSEGHRFWCSAKEEEGHIHGIDPQHQQQLIAQHEARQAQLQAQQDAREHHPQHPRPRAPGPNTTPTNTAADGTEPTAFIPPSTSAHANATRAERREMREHARQVEARRQEEQSRRLLAERQGHLDQPPYHSRPPNPGPESARHGRREQDRQGMTQEEARRHWEQQQQRRQRRAARGGEEATSSTTHRQQQQQQPQQDIWDSTTYSPAMSSRRRAETTSYVGPSTEAGRSAEQQRRQQQHQEHQEVTSPQQPPWFLLRTRRDARSSGVAPAVAGTSTTGQPVSVASTATGAAAAAEAAGDGSGSPMRLSTLDDDDMIVG